MISLLYLYARVERFDVYIHSQSKPPINRNLEAWRHANLIIYKKWKVTFIE